MQPDTAGSCPSRDIRDAVPPKSPSMQDPLTDAGSEQAMAVSPSLRSISPALEQGGALEKDSAWDAEGFPAEGPLEDSHAWEAGATSEDFFAGDQDQYEEELCEDSSVEDYQMGDAPAAAEELYEDSNEEGYQTGDAPAAEEEYSLSPKESSSQETDNPFSKPLDDRKQLQMKMKIFGTSFNVVEIRTASSTVRLTRLPKNMNGTKRQSMDSIKTLQMPTKNSMKSTKLKASTEHSLWILEQHR